MAIFKNIIMSFKSSQTVPNTKCYIVKKSAQTVQTVQNIAPNYFPSSSLSIFKELKAKFFCNKNNYCTWTEEV